MPKEEDREGIGKCIRDYEFDWNLTSVSSKSCPVLDMSGEMNTLFQCFNDYEFRHILPYDGGGLGQPCLLMHGISIVGSVWDEYNESIRKK